MKSDDSFKKKIAGIWTSVEYGDTGKSRYKMNGSICGSQETDCQSVATTSEDLSAAMKQAKSIAAQKVVTSKVIGLDVAGSFGNRVGSGNVVLPDKNTNVGDIPVSTSNVVRPPVFTAPVVNLSVVNLPVINPFEVKPIEFKPIEFNLIEISPPVSRSSC